MTKSFKIALWCVLVFRGTLLFSAGPVKVALNSFVQDEKGKKMQAIIAVFRYTGQPLEDPVNLGVETKKAPGKFTFKMPDMQGIKDTSYAYIFYGGIDKRKELPGYTLMVIGNNTRSFRPALLWIDKNHNLDLSDDGAPDTFPSTVPDKDITLYHPDIPNAAYTVNISRYSFSYNTKYIGMLDDYYRENSGGRKFAGALYSFKEQRINTIAGDCKIGNDSFRIGVKDVNCNGLYNDAGTDYILIGDYGAEVLPDNIHPIEKKDGATVFERNGKRYIIRYIERVGAYLTLEEDEGAKIKNKLVTGKKLKKFRFYTTDRERRTVSVRKYRKKPLYIFVWRFGQPGFSEDTAALRIIARDYSDRVQVLALNYGETPRELRTFSRVNHINWIVGQSTAKINSLLFTEQFPHGVLTGKRLRVKQSRISPAELLSLLRNKQL